MLVKIQIATEHHTRFFSSICDTLRKHPAQCMCFPLVNTSLEAPELTPDSGEYQESGQTTRKPPGHHEENTRRSSQHHPRRAPKDRQGTTGRQPRGLEDHAETSRRPRKDQKITKRPPRHHHDTTARDAICNARTAFPQVLARYRIHCSRKTSAKPTHCTTAGDARREHPV